MPKTEQNAHFHPTLFGIFNGSIKNKANVMIIMMVMMSSTRSSKALYVHYIYFMS